MRKGAEFIMARKVKKQMKKIVAFILIAAIVFGVGNPYGLRIGKYEEEVAQAAVTTAITSMDYYDDDNGPTQDKSGTEAQSYGFVMPKFNGKTSQELPLPDVEADLQLYVKQAVGTGGEWKKIDDVPYFMYNSTWGWEHQQWAEDADGWICWFKLEETTEIRFHGITNNINLDYKFTYTKLPILELTSISAGSEANITADSTGGSATHWNLWTFNNNPNVTYDQIKDDLEILVDNHDGKGFVQFLANADSGFIWDQNFGIYTDGFGGYWFLNIDWSFTLRFQKKGNSSIYTDVNVTYNEPVRANYTLTPYAETTYDTIAENKTHTGSAAFVLPKIGGTEAVRKDLDLFSYEVCIGATYNNGNWSGGEWVPLNDVALSQWVYQGNGYSKYSGTQQWGYFVDHVYGLWFRPVKKNTYLRIGYPQNGQSGGSINNNYVYYTIIGDPEAVVPDVSDMGDITVDDNDDSDIYVPDGWSMIWNDEFSGDSLDDTKWTRQTGYLLDENDIDTFGWGNKELQHYTDSTDNSDVSDGMLNITLRKGSKTFAEADNPSKTKTALYSSGKLISKNKFSVKYGRVDFRAKLPTGTGIWPAMWMMPNDDRYGTWASSGEIDVFEGRGRVPQMAFGTIHFGSQWPGNVNASDFFNMVENGNKKTDFSDWHVYSIVWEEESIKIYADGKCYFKCTNAEWYSGADRGNINAPFDQRFYLIINLAAGGVFDNFYEPDYATFEQADMYVDYVRVYQRQVGDNEDEKPDTIQGVNTNGTDDNLYGDYKLADGSSSGENPTTKPATTTPASTTVAAETTSPIATTTATETTGATETTTPVDSTTVAETTTIPEPTDAQVTTTANSGAETTASDTSNETTASGSSDKTTVADGGNKTTASSDAGNISSTQNSLSKKVKAPAKAKIKKVYAKKKAAKKIKVKLKKTKRAKGYQVAVYKTKKNAKKNKKAIVKKIVKKRNVTIKSKKLKNKKELYVRVRAYVLDTNGKKVYGKWSKIKKVKIKK